MSHSYHIFYFPFKWENPEMAGKPFMEQTCLEELDFNPHSNWIHTFEPKDSTEADELYNEKNYFYEFVHPVLYDTGQQDSIVKHFERKEPQYENVIYKIKCNKDKTYELKVESINLNLYSTGVGIMSFYLINEKENQNKPEDILAINQYGRRIFPPFIKDLEDRSLIAESISVEGLYGEPSRYYEDFSTYNNQKSWIPSCFIKNLITDLIEKIEVIPVIDDRMFINCWYGNDSLSNELKDDRMIENFIMSSNKEFWYQYLFVDFNGATCQNEKLKNTLLEKQSYLRWQKYGTLYGASHYSFVLLTDTSNFNKNIVLVHMRTIYSRMVELILIQRASILKFSGEVTRVSRLPDNKKIVNQINSLYRNYIRFVNQIYFREVIAQDQGIELYKLLSEIMETDKYIQDLDAEIEELHKYVSLLDERARNKNAEKLNKIAAIFLPATLIAGVFGMNYHKGDIISCFWGQLAIVIAGALMFAILLLRRK